MKQVICIGLLTFIGLFVFTFLCGSACGYQYGFGQAEKVISFNTDYYRRASEMGTKAPPFTREEAIRFLQYCQWVHQLYLDNPNWLNYDQGQLAREFEFVVAYGKTIEFMEGR